MYAILTIVFQGFSHKHDATVKEADVLKRFGVYMPANGVQAEVRKNAEKTPFNLFSAGEGAERRQRHTPGDIWRLDAQKWNSRTLAAAGRPVGIEAYQCCRC